MIFNGVRDCFAVAGKRRKNSLELNGWTEAAMSGALAERVAVRTAKPPERGTNGGCEPPASGARVVPGKAFFLKGDCQLCVSEGLA